MTLARSFEGLAAETSLRLVELIQVFNSLVCDEILGGAAFKRNKIKHITSKHLCKFNFYSLSLHVTVFNEFTLLCCSVGFELHLVCDRWGTLPAVADGRVNQRWSRFGSPWERRIEPNRRALVTHCRNQRSAYEDPADELDEVARGSKASWFWREDRAWTDSASQPVHAWHTQQLDKDAQSSQC